MSDLLSCASGIVILFVILYATGLEFKRKVSPTLTVLAYVPLTALLFFTDMLAPDGPYAQWAFPYVYLLYMLPIYGLLCGKLPDKIFVFLLQMISGCAVGWFSSLAAQIFLAEPGIYYKAVRLGLLLLFGSLYLYWMKTRGQRFLRELLTRQTGWVWIAYAFGPCLGCVILSMAFENSVGQPALFSGLLLIFVMWSVAVLFLAILIIRSNTQTVYDLELARHIIDATTAQAREFSSMVETARILRHDCKHHLHVAQILLETGRTSEAREYLLAFGTKCDEGTLPIYCKNPAVNALLAGYHNRSRDEGIDYSAVVELPDNPPMDNFELCTLLGNLLENALEACRHAPQDQRMITLKGAPQGSQLLISVKNTFDGTIMKEEGHIVSRKGDSGGLGIKSIRAIAGRHRGEYIPAWDEHTFTASVMLKL